MVCLNNYDIPNRFRLQLIRGTNNSNMALKMATLLSNNKYVYIEHNVKMSRRPNDAVSLC